MSFCAFVVFKVERKWENLVRVEESERKKKKREQKINNEKEKKKKTHVVHLRDAQQLLVL